MSKGFFTNRSFKPNEEEFKDILRDAKPHWDLLSGFLTNELKLKGELKFYGVNYGWALRFERSGKSVIALYPNNDNFIVQIILNKNQTDSALSLDLDPKIVEIIKSTKSIHEGKWIYLEINKNSDIRQIIKLVEIRLFGRNTKPF